MLVPCGCVRQPSATPEHMLFFKTYALPAPIAVLCCVAGSVDLGAMWIHEATPSNPLYNLAKDELGIDMSPIVQYGSGSVFDTEGKPVNMALYAVSFHTLHSD